MITVEEEKKEWNGDRLKKIFKQRKCKSIEDRFSVLIDVVKSLPIKGCITGSCFLEKFDPVGWGSTPDVDLFVFSQNDLVLATSIARYGLGMKPGTGTKRSKEQEKIKLDMLIDRGMNYKTGITTYKFHRNGVVLNITMKCKRVDGRWMVISDTPGILQSFDISIVMQGYDIKSHVFYDMRIGDPNVAYPNPLRDHDCMMWTVAKWIRQFDRVLKYYERGYDTRPVAEFYIEMIDKCIDTGCLFDSEESKDSFEQLSQEFLQTRAKIVDWYEEHKED